MNGLHLDGAGLLVKSEYWIRDTSATLMAN